jgi:hypothetical protein
VVGHDEDVFTTTQGGRKMEVRFTELDKTSGRYGVKLDGEKVGYVAQKGSKWVAQIGSKRTTAAKRSEAVQKQFPEATIVW